jgi:V8-like Glu-specific endopeptidase
MTSLVGAQNDDYPYSSVVYVVSTFPNGDMLSGTGVMVGPNDVLTASHLLWNVEDGGAAVSVSISPGYDNGATPYGTYAAAEWSYYELDVDGDDRLTIDESQYDVGIIGLSSRVGDQTGWFGMDPNGTSDFYNLTGYPATFNSASGFAQMTNDWGYADEHATNWVFDYVDITSTPGNSGGPLWYQGADGPYVVGVASTTSWAADIYLTYDQIQTWMDNDDLIPAPVVEPLLTYADLFQYSSYADTGWSYADLLTVQENQYWMVG